MSGLIGGILRRHLDEAGGYELSALNRSVVEGVESHQADVADLEATKPAFEGVDVVVHLSANLIEGDWDAMVQTNLIGTYNVYEAARLAGVKRVVFASSGATIRGLDYVEPYTTLAEGRFEEMPDTFEKVTVDQVRPMGVYGATKVWGEALGRVFTDTHDISIICVRIGSVRPENRPLTGREYSVYFSHHDVATLLRAAIDAPDELKYEIVFGTSDNQWGYRDLEHTRDVLGWTPRDSAESFGPPEQ